MNTNHYEKQKDRALKRKFQLVEMKGGKCEICGYDKNYASFDFHHLNPEEKEFQLDARHLSNTKIEKLMEEAKKCILICANCHREIHYPHLDKNIVIEKINEINDNHLSIHIKNRKKQSICKTCGCEYDYIKGKIYCSNECREKDKQYPEIEQIIEKYTELGSWEKVAKYFNTTRRIIQRIRKINNK